MASVLSFFQRLAGGFASLFRCTPKPVLAAPVVSTIDTYKVSIRGIDVNVNVPKGTSWDLVMAFEPFKAWLKKLNETTLFNVKAVDVQSVDMFGPKRVGFLKFAADITLEQPKQSDDAGHPQVSIPGITFMRGGAVGILVILECDEKEYTVLTVQARVPIANPAFAEIPADGSGKFAGIAAKELQEETGIVIEEKSLIDLTGEAWGDKYEGDEFLRLFAYKASITPVELHDLQGRLTGLAEEGERISLKVIPLEHLWTETCDAKALCALYLYNKMVLKKSIV